MSKSNKIQLQRRRTVTVLGSLIVLLVVAVIGYALWRQANPLSAPVITLNRSTATPNQHVPGGNTTSGTGSTSSKGSPDSQPGSPPQSGVQPEMPTGQFVSNHYPNLSGKPYPNSETSTCTTTPGTQCTITFTMGTTTRSLPAKTTDSDGNAVWDNWTLQNIGLNQGTWHITAVATNGSKPARASDITDLQVGP